MMMRKIEELFDNINEEYEDAGKYADLAVAYKASCPEVASVYAQLSQQELAHAEVLHAQLKRIVGAMEPQHEGVIWYHEHEAARWHDHAAKIRMKHEVYARHA